MYANSAIDLTLLFFKNKIRLEFLDFKIKMPSFTISSADEFSPLQPIIPNLSTSEEMSILTARIAELNRSNIMDPSIASSADFFGQDGNGSDDDEFNLDDGSGQKKEERKTPKNEVVGDQLSKILEKIRELEKQQKEQTKTNSGQLSKMQNDQKIILEKISELEKQQKEQSKATADQFSKMQNDQKILLEKVSELEKEQKQRKALLNFRQNYWDANFCDEKLEIIGEKKLTVRYKGNENGWCSVLAKHPILLNNNSSDIFYYEISVKNKKNLIIFGFAVKQPTQYERMIIKSTHAYDIYGNIWINGERKERNAQYSYGVGDTVGIGVNLTTRQIIFTKNGLRLDFSDFFVAPSFADDSLHPFVSIWHSGDQHQIEANFGSNFKFDLTTL